MQTAGLRNNTLHDVVGLMHRKYVNSMVGAKEKGQSGNATVHSRALSASTNWGHADRRLLYMIN